MLYSQINATGLLFRYKESLMKSNKLLPFAAVAALALMLGGCASDQLKKDVADAKASAEQAQAAADKAQKSADAAKARADAADARALAAENRAETALESARGANMCCIGNSEKIDRMFRKAMTK
jgi:hypothetical protein